ncbi:MAG: DUF4397 domain-containing protein, partial [Deltaproteobacteria bacterium]
DSPGWGASGVVWWVPRGGSLAVVGRGGGVRDGGCPSGWASLGGFAGGGTSSGGLGGGGPSTPGPGL